MSLGAGFGFLLFFRVVSGDYGKPLLLVFLTPWPLIFFWIRGFIICRWIDDAAKNPSWAERFRSIPFWSKFHAFFFVVQKIGMVFSNSVSRNLLFLFMFFGLSNLPLCNFSAFSIFLGGESSILEPPNTFSDLSEGQPLIPREKPKRN